LVEPIQKLREIPVTHQLPNGIDPWKYINRPLPEADIEALERLLATVPMVRAPDDGFFVIPVPEDQLNKYARCSSSKKTRHLENWGPRFFVVRSPKGAVGPYALKRLYKGVYDALEGDGVSHDAIKPFMKHKGTRSNFSARHVGVSNHYGADHAGSGGIHLTKDTIKQEKKETDAIHRLFVTIQEEIVPVLSRFLHHIDPTVYSFQQW
jgi:hypothetical protein